MIRHAETIDGTTHTVSVEDVQEELRNLLRLAVVGDHVRWVLKGEGSSELAAWLREAVSQWRAWAEVWAERMVQVDVAPDGRVKTLARDITRQWVPSGWLTVPDARDLLVVRLSELIERTKVCGPLTTVEDDQSRLAEVESGLEAQRRALVLFGPQG